MEDKGNQTIDLLHRWHAGDRSALEQLLADNLEWIRGRVRKRLGQRLRGKMESLDLVQEAMVDVLRNGPRFLISDQAQFRGFMARVVENVICDQDAWYRAKRRELAREKPLPQGSILALDAGARSVTRPSQAFQRDEVQACLRLALELLSEEERRVLVLRQWENHSFAEVGEELGISEEAARKRFRRALDRLTAEVKRLRDGELL